ncbi:MAG: translation initiation factor [Flavobacteriaceae bacterium]|nr:MAG: translation initiation factor [Flavobacteriaceae bacterium]
MKNNKFNSLEDLKSLIPADYVAEKESEEETVEELENQHIEAHLSKKGRGGKTVTLLKGIKGDDQQIKTLAKEIKTFLGVGGSLKDGEIIIQGDYREKIIDFLVNKGHKVKRVGG